MKNQLEPNGSQEALILRQDFSFVSIQQPQDLLDAKLYIAGNNAVVVAVIEEEQANNTHMDGKQTIIHVRRKLPRSAEYKLSSVHEAELFPWLIHILFLSLLACKSVRAFMYTRRRRRRSSRASGMVVVMEQ